MPHIHPASELKTNLDQLAKICHSENEPVYLTRKGHGDLVLMSLAGFLYCMLLPHRNFLYLDTITTAQTDIWIDKTAGNKDRCRSTNTRISLNAWTKDWNFAPVRVEYFNQLGNMIPYTGCTNTTNNFRPSFSIQTKLKPLQQLLFVTFHLKEWAQRQRKLCNGLNFPPE